MCCGFGFGVSSASRLCVLPEAPLSSGVASDSPANTTYATRRTHVATSDHVSHVPATRYVFAHLSNPSCKLSFLCSL